MVKRIEFVCTANNEKNPIELAKARDHVKKFKSENKIIGMIGLTKVNRFEGTAYIGYWLGENYWRKGYMTEALNVIIDFAFNKSTTQPQQSCGV